MKKERGHRLPNFNEFSVGTLGQDLGVILDAVMAGAGDRNAIAAALIFKFPKLARTKNPKEQVKRAKNVLIGMMTCGLFDRNTSGLTTLGEELLATSDVAKRNLRFAEHLLCEHHGLSVLRAAATIQDRGEVVSKKAMAEELRSQGFFLTTNSGDPSKMRMWLELAGLVDQDWKICESKMQAIIGATIRTVDAWAQLPPAQRLVLETLKNLTQSRPPEWVSGAHLKRLCDEREPGRLPEDTLRSAVFNPLAKGGWLEQRGTGQGRGGKIGELRATERLLTWQHKAASTVVFSPEPELAALMRRPLAELWAEMKSTSTYTAGMALEAVALRLVRDLGLQPVKLRERGRETGGAEVDVIADGRGLLYSRWLVQCKNSSSVGLAALAKEIGMAMLLKAHVVVVVTTGRFASTVREHADRLNEDTYLQAVLVDGDVLANWKKHGGVALVDHFAETAKRTLRAKATQVSRDA